MEGLRKDKNLVRIAGVSADILLLLTWRCGPYRALASSL
jgi:hypothetical protein